MLTELKTKLQKGKKIVLKIRVVPKSGKHEIGDVMADGSIKIKLKATPEDNKANKELIELLSDFFEVRYQHIMILSGETGRIKLVEIHPS